MEWLAQSGPLPTEMVQGGPGAPLACLTPDVVKGTKTEAEARLVREVLVPGVDLVLQIGRPRLDGW